MGSWSKAAKRWGMFSGVRSVTGAPRKDKVSARSRRDWKRDVRQGRD